MWFSSPFLDFYGDCQVTSQFLVLGTGINKHERFLLESSQGLWKSQNQWLERPSDHPPPPFIWQRRNLRPVRLQSFSLTDRQGFGSAQGFSETMACWVSQGIQLENGVSILYLCGNRKTLSPSGQILGALVVAKGNYDGITEELLIHFRFTTGIVDLT